MFKYLAIIYFYCCNWSICASGVTRREAWVPVGKPHPNSTVRTTFAIKQTNLEWLKRELYQVSNPKSPRYGRYSNFDKVAKVVHGRPESVSALEEALLSINVRLQSWHYTVGKDFAVVDLPIWGAERLFGASIYTYRSRRDTRVRIHRSPRFTIPDTLQEHLDYVTGISYNSLSSKFYTVNLANSVDSRREIIGVTPDQIDSLYNIDGYVSKSEYNSQAVASFLGEYFNPDDLRRFQELFGIPPMPIAKVMGGNAPRSRGNTDEGNLDVQYITAVGRNVTTWVVYTPETANSGQEDFLVWITKQVNMTDSPFVHSISYGDFADTIDNKYKFRVESEFIKFGVSGRTILVASGDKGVNCDAKGEYRDEWPTSSPHVTSVGGTLNFNTAWASGGGGFSNTFEMPDWQKEVVEEYLTSFEPKGNFNRSGRAYPDVSAFAQLVVTMVDGHLQYEGGTSCSAPIFAGIVSLMNDIRLLKNKPTLGFLNPFLYQTLRGQGFHDVTEGNNSGNNSGAGQGRKDGSCPGFDAVRGWDPATGWGQPNFSALKELI